MAPKWLQPVVWTVAGAALVWAVVGHSLIWVTHLTSEGGEVDRMINEDLAFEIGSVTPNEAAHRDFLHGQGYSGYVNGSLDITPEATHWNSYWRHHHLPEMTEEKNTMETMENPKLFNLRAPGQLVAVYLVYFLPMFFVGLCGWITTNWPVQDHQVWGWNARIRAAFNRQVPPVAFWKKRINGLSFSELGVILLFFIPKISHLIWFLNMSRNEWLEGVEASYAVKFPSETQYWLERIGLWLAVDFEVQAPFLFAFAARGSLVNSYLGVAFGTIIKWHRWMGIWTMTNIFTHGILYQVLLRSESHSTWAVFYTRMHYMHGASSLGGRMSWLSMIIMGLCVIPLVRRYYYKVFYRVHVVGAILFVCFGIVHSRKVFVFFGPGLVLYGIDVAYRWLQASYDVILHVNPGSKLVSIVIPLEEGVKYADGSHVWVAIPELGKLEYHPFCVASTSADPAWKSSILLYCKSFNRWTDRLLEGATTGKLHKIRARVQGPFGGHTLPVAEMEAPQHMIVFVGGVGAPTVLSILKRLAIHRDANKQHLAGYPKVKVFHTARTLDEVILLAPLLDHPCVFDISLHYTGKTPLTTCTLIMPSPVPLDSENPCGHFACDTETLLHLQDAPNLKVYNGDASASIANSKALSKAFSERLNIHSVAHDSKNSKNSGRKSISMMSKKINNKFAGKEVGGFKKVTPTFAPDPDPRLVSLRGKWESLVVWVGAWLVAFASLLLGELWHNSSLDHQAGLVNDQSRNHRRYRMAVFNITGAFLMVPLVPLFLIVLSRMLRLSAQKVHSALPNSRVEVHGASAFDDLEKKTEKGRMHDHHAYKPHESQVWEESRTSFSITGGLERTIVESTEEGEAPANYVNSVYSARPNRAQKENDLQPRQGSSAGLTHGQNPRRHYNAPLAHHAHALPKTASIGRSREASTEAEPSHTHSRTHTQDLSRDRSHSVNGHLENVPEGEVMTPRRGASPSPPRWPPMTPDAPPHVDKRVSRSRSTHARQNVPEHSMTELSEVSNAQPSSQERRGRARGNDTLHASHASHTQQKQQKRGTIHDTTYTEESDDFVHDLTSRARSPYQRQDSQRSSEHTTVETGREIASTPSIGWPGIGSKRATEETPVLGRQSSYSIGTPGSADRPRSGSASAYGSEERLLKSSGSGRVRYSSSGRAPRSGSGSGSAAYRSGDRPVSGSGRYSSSGSAGVTPGSEERLLKSYNSRSDRRSSTNGTYGSQERPISGNARYSNREQPGSSDQPRSTGSGSARHSSGSKRRSSSRPDSGGGGARDALRSGQGVELHDDIVSPYTGRRTRRAAQAVAEGSKNHQRQRSGTSHDSGPSQPPFGSGAMSAGQSVNSSTFRSSSELRPQANLNSRKASILSFAEYARSESHGASDSSTDAKRNRLCRSTREVPDLKPAKASLRAGIPTASSGSSESSRGHLHDGADAPQPVSSLSKWGDLPRLRSLNALIASGSHANSRTLSREGSTANTPRSQSQPGHDRTDTMYSQRSFGASEGTDATGPSRGFVGRSGRMHEPSAYGDVEYLGESVDQRVRNSQQRSPSAASYQRMGSMHSSQRTIAHGDRSSSARTRSQSPQPSSGGNNNVDAGYYRGYYVAPKPEAQLKGITSKSPSGRKPPASPTARSRSPGQTYTPPDNLTHATHSSKPQMRELRTLNTNARSQSPVNSAVHIPASPRNPGLQSTPRKSYSNKFGGLGNSTDGFSADHAAHASRSGLSGLSGRLWRQLSAKDDKSHSLMGLGRLDTCEDIPSGALFGQDVDNIVLVDAEEPEKVTIMTGRRGAVPQAIKSGRPDVAAEINACFEASQKTGYTLSVWSAGPGVLNEAVHLAAHALPLSADVRVFPMAYEL